MADIENQIIELIKASLPGQMQGAFKSFMDDVEAKSERLEKIEATHLRLINEMSELNSKYNNLLTEQVINLNLLKKYEEQEVSVLQREKTVLLKEINQELDYTKVRLEAEQEKGEAVFKLVDKVFSNPKFIKTETWNQPTVIPPGHPPVKDQYGQTQYGQDGWIKETEITKTTEIQEQK